uniref:M23 family metallopeptidase n=3 Tax=Bartonella TaxID=773 RepID=UPI002431F707
VAVVAPQATGISKMRWPAQGRILSSFGQKEGSSTNDGIDIMAPEGSSVKAAENGVVIYAGDGLKEFGNTVLIRHENNIVTVYGHNSKILVQRGQKVRRGDEIAKSGMSGNASTPRVHFEVRKNSSPVNPIKYLEN